MKTHFLILVISAVLSLACGAAETNGFLVIEISRYAYGTTDGKAAEPEIKQSYKIPLTAEFLSNFKTPTNDHSKGNGFCCVSRFEKPQDAGFMWWLEKTTNHRWYAHMWASLSNPSVTEGVTLKNLDDLDMSYEKSYVDAPKGMNVGGVNISFSAKYVSNEEMLRKDFVPTAAVKKADQSYLFQGDTLTNCPILLNGLFQ